MNAPSWVYYDVEIIPTTSSSLAIVAGASAERVIQNWF